MRVGACECINNSALPRLRPVVNRNMELVSCVVLLLFVEAVLGEPKSQAQFAPAAPGLPVQFAAPQQQPFLQQQQFLAAQPAAPGVFEGIYTPQQFLPQAAQPIQQVILPSNVDRQVRDRKKSRKMREFVTVSSLLSRNCEMGMGLSRRNSLMSKIVFNFTGLDP